QVEDYAAYLGIDAQQEPEYLWIAEMALMAPLPPGWTENKDSTGNVFFHNRSMSLSSYEHPLDPAFKSYYKKLKAA
ncbi:hypothetical protein GUITHDRAFT_54803, partial [Guillardia theta CCMP2712]